VFPEFFFTIFRMLLKIRPFLSGFNILTNLF
jgi:hypothetical protein